MIVARKGREIIELKRITAERESYIREVLSLHEYNIPHTQIAEMLKLSRATVVRWLNKYYVDSPQRGLSVLRVKIPTMAKLDCPHNCYICGKPIPLKRADSSFCSKRCKRFYNIQLKCNRNPDYYAYLQTQPWFEYFLRGFQ
jgi:predicted nucleic acid-binding Zn ribbon protein